MSKICKKAQKTFISFLLTIVMVLLTVMPALAEESAVPSLDISQWAVGILNEGERYGIYPLEWYYDNFRTEISQERLEALLNAVAAKIGALGLKEKEDFTPVPYKGDCSRDDVVTRLYNIVAKYELPITVSESPADYMQERGILKGTPRGLELEQGCNTEDAVVLAVRLINDTYNLVQAGAKGLAWKVENKGNVVYLLGSIHIGSSDLYPIDQRLLQAFYESDALIVEANLYDQQNVLDYYMEKATYQDGTTIKDNISQETYEKLLLVFEMYGMPEEIYGLFKPWSLANTLSVLSVTSSENIEEGAQSANLGVDVYFLSNAVLLQKPIYELEGLKFQVDLFDGLSPEYQDYYLNMVLNSILGIQTEDTETEETENETGMDENMADTETEAAEAETEEATGTEAEETEAEAETTEAEKEIMDEAEQTEVTEEAEDAEEAEEAEKAEVTEDEDKAEIIETEETESNEEEAEVIYDSATLLAEWLKLWRNGDIEGFARSYRQSNDESDDELSALLFGKRDQNMADKIIELLESDEKGTYFVVIGAGHLVVENTVIDKLREKGYIVEEFYK